MSELLPLIALLIAVRLYAGLFAIGVVVVMVPALFFAFAPIGVDPDVIMHCAVATSVSVIIVNG